LKSSILLIAPEAQSLIVAEALQRELNLCPVRTPNRRAGIAALRRAEYDVILLDIARANVDHLTDALFQKTGTALVLEVDFRISSPMHMVRQVRSTLQLRSQHQTRARESALATVKGELRRSLTGLLLHSQIMLNQAPPDQQAKLRYLVELTGNLSDCLRA